MKLLTFFYSCVLLIVLAVWLSASNAPLDRERLLVRKWRFVHVEIPEVEQALEGAGTQEKVALYNQMRKELATSYMEFKDDGRYEAQVMNQYATGTWSLNGAQTHIVIQQDKKAQSGEMEIITLSKKELVLYGGGQGNDRSKMFLVPAVTED